MSYFDPRSIYYTSPYYTHKGQIIQKKPQPYSTSITPEEAEMYIKFGILNNYIPPNLLTSTIQPFRLPYEFGVMSLFPIFSPSSESPTPPLNPSSSEIKPFSLPFSWFLQIPYLISVPTSYSFPSLSATLFFYHIRFKDNLSYSMQIIINRSPEPQNLLATTSVSWLPVDYFSEAESLKPILHCHMMQFDIPQTLSAFSRILLFMSFIFGCTVYLSDHSERNYKQTFELLRTVSSIDSSESSLSLFNLENQTINLFP